MYSRTSTKDPPAPQRYLFAPEPLCRQSRENRTPGTFRCHHCQQPFPTPDDLEVHLAASHDKTKTRASIRSPPTNPLSAHDSRNPSVTRGSASSGQGSAPAPCPVAGRQPPHQWNANTFRRVLQSVSTTSAASGNPAPSQLAPTNAATTPCQAAKSSKSMPSYTPISPEPTLTRPSAPTNLAEILKQKPQEGGGATSLSLSGSTAVQQTALSSKSGLPPSSTTTATIASAQQTAKTIEGSRASATELENRESSDDDVTILGQVEKKKKRKRDSQTSKGSMKIPKTETSHVHLQLAPIQPPPLTSASGEIARPLAAPEPSEVVAPEPREPTPNAPAAVTRSMLSIVKSESLESIRQQQQNHQVTRPPCGLRPPPLPQTRVVMPRLTIKGEPGATRETASPPQREEGSVSSPELLSPSAPPPSVEESVIGNAMSEDPPDEDELSDSHTEPAYAENDTEPPLERADRRRLSCSSLDATVVPPTTAPTPRELELTRQLAEALAQKTEADRSAGAATERFENLRTASQTSLRYLVNLDEAIRLHDAARQHNERSDQASSAEIARLKDVIAKQEAEHRERESQAAQQHRAEIEDYMRRESEAGAKISEVMANLQRAVDATCRIEANFEEKLEAERAQWKAAEAEYKSTIEAQRAAASSQTQTPKYADLAPSAAAVAKCEDTTSDESTLGSSKCLRLEISHLDERVIVTTPIMQAVLQYGAVGVMLQQDKRTTGLKLMANEVHNKGSTPRISVSAAYDVKGIFDEAPSD